MTTGSALQTSFLEALSRDKTPVSMYLVNGIKLHGVVGLFDDNVIMLENTIAQMVFKHAISTIVPNKPIVSDADDVS